MKGLIWVFLLSVLAALAIVGIGLVLSSLPGFVQVDPGAAFVYPDGNTFLLALPSGTYLVGPEMVGGCYYLYPPQGGETYGRAEWAWFVCGN
jgi:hypothetical protein